MVMSASRIKSDDNRYACAGIWLSRLCAGAVLVALAACHKPAAELPKQTTEVTVMTVEPRDTPVDFEFTAQTESSREVQIRARVDGFLDKRVYTEGQLVHAGQTLFLMDPKPFEAALQSAKGPACAAAGPADRDESQSCPGSSAGRTERIEPEGT